MSMDFKPSPSETFAQAFQALLDEAIEMEAMEREPRDYLGGSRLGIDCERALGYEYTHTPKDPDRNFKGSTLRIFDRGHDAEERMAEYIRKAGFTLLTERPDGQQFGFWLMQDERGVSRISGHIDGVITAGPEEIGEQPVSYPMLWENKELNDKHWNALVKKGLKVSKPVYYVQMQCYQRFLGLADNPGLFTAKNADKQTVYAELVPHVPAVVDEAIEKGQRVVLARSPEDLPRVADRPDDHRCRWCDYKARCWEAPEKTATAPVAGNPFAGFGRV